MRKYANRIIFRHWMPAGSWDSRYDTCFDNATWKALGAGVAPVTRSPGGLAELCSISDIPGRHTWGGVSAATPKHDSVIQADRPR